MAIKLEKVSFTYNKSKNPNYVDKDINLNIESHDEFLAIVGHTGSGKSTLVQLLNGLLIPSKGSIDIDFEDEEKHVYYHIKGDMKKPMFSYSENVDKIKYKKHVLLKPLRKHIGMVFQFPEYQLFEETVLKDIMFGPMNFSSKTDGVEQDAKDIAKMLGIESSLDKSPFALSGGKMRKVAIAGILASHPDILILDEPSVGLDPISKKELFKFLKRLNEEFHKTIIIITHDMDVVGEYAKRVVVLNHGSIQFDGSKDELFKNDEIIQNNHLDYPNIVTLLKQLKTKLNVDIDEYQYDIDNAYNEILKKLGEKHE